MADQRSAFRFRLPWLPAASTPRQTTPQPTASRTPATAPRRAAETQVPPQPKSTTTPTPSQSTGGATPAPRRASEAQVPPQPTSTTTPTPGQSTGSAIPTPTPERPAEIQVPSQPTSTLAPTPGQSTGSATPAPAPQRTTETQVPSQPTSTTTRISPRSVDTETSVQPTTETSTTRVTPQTQSTTTKIPSSATPQKAKTEAPSPPTATKTPILENTQTAQTQPPTKPTATASATVTTTERPPLRPPGATAPKAPLPQPQASRTESQPSSPSHLTSQTRVSSQPESPSRATTQPRSSQPSTPSRATSQSRATSLLSSPSRTGSPKSPASQTSSQPRSQPRTASRPAGQTASTSPSSKAAQGQPITATLAESTFPSKSEPKLNSKSTVSEQESLEELQPKEEAKSGMIYDSQKQTPVETSTKPNEMELQPLNESGRRTTISTPNGGLQTSVPTKKSDTPTSSAPESFQQDLKPEETKEVKEIMQEIKEKTYKGGIEKDDADPASAVQTKEQLSFIYQSEQAQLAVDQKEVMPKPASNGKETKMTAQPRNKTVSVESRQKQAMTNGEKIPLHEEIRGDISKLVQKMAAGDTKQSIGDRPVTVVTLAGENRGATMQLGTDLMKKGGAVHIHRGYKVNPDESIETTITEDGSSKAKSEDTEDMEDQAPEAFVNSNVQGINNSIMFNGSITEQNPGVHLVHSRFPIKFKNSTAQTEFPGREKTEFSTTRAQRLTYEPMVRRRCLRGLFLESSDSDPENTTKPRHHGCRVGCKEKSEENKIDVFWQASP